MSDDEEDFEALFFAECDDNLSDLQGRLDALLAGDRDSETVNAAFRAVHSVKGGAAAFGFDGLIAFAHDFETVMDRVRAGELALGAEVCELLLRAADVMSGLVEAARSRTPGPKDRAVELSEQLAALLGEAAPGSVPAEVEPAPAPAEPAPVEAAEELPSVTVRVAPGPDFLIAGLDPLAMIRAAGRFGLMGTVVEGEVPPIDALRPGACPLAWRLTFEPEDIAGLLAFFETYSYLAEITFDGVPEARPAAPAPVAATPDPEPSPAGTGAEPTPAAQPAPARKASEPKRDGAEGGEASRAGGARSLRVDLDRVDRLVNLVGEVLIAQAALSQRLGETGGPAQAALEPMIEALTRQTRDLQESVMSIRAQPVRAIFNRLPRILRELGDKLGKEARLVTSGEEVEVDTTVVEELYDPLVHMLRNSMDHGLERPDERLAAGKPRTGTVRLSAEQRGGRVRIILADDGRGIDRARVLAKAREAGLVGPGETPEDTEIDALIFHPGFSTASEVSSVSGRGVGMDVVRQRIQSLGGRCSLENRPGRGTIFVITLPLTLAVMDGMTVRVDDQQFILPVANVVEALEIETDKMAELPDRSRVLQRRGGYLPILSLRSALRLPELHDAVRTAIVVDTEIGGHVAVLVDDLVGQRQVVLKSLEANVGKIEGVSGATILGDGQVALVLDVPALFRLGSHDMERMI